MKKKLYNLLENDKIASGKKFMFDIFLALVILVSIILIFLENEKGELSPTLDIINTIINYFFIFEFIARFYVISNFRYDYKEDGVIYALKQKWKWFLRPTTIIDFLAIMPGISFFRIFRTFRFLKFLRFFRILRIYRSLKTFREIDKVFTIIKGMTKESRMFYVFFIFTIFITLLISFALYISESGHQETEFNTFKDSVWYAIKVIGFGDDTPKTIIGKIFASLLLLVNMAIVSFFISIIVTKIQNVMNAIASGKIGKLKLENHIVICGYTTSSIRVMKDLLKDESNINNIVLITKKEIEDNLNGVIYVNEDFTKLKSLLNVNIEKSKFAVVFAEFGEKDSVRDIDLRTVLTIFHIEKINPNIHTIAEINEEENAEIIKEKIDGDEILFKEKIDAQIISNCIKHRNISPMIYDLFGENDQERLAETTLLKLKIKSPISVKEVKQLFLEKEGIFLGFIDAENNSFLSPKNDVVVDVLYRLIYLK